MTKEEIEAAQAKLGLEKESATSKPVQITRDQVPSVSEESKTEKDNLETVTKESNINVNDKSHIEPKKKKSFIDRLKDVFGIED